MKPLFCSVYFWVLFWVKCVEFWGTPSLYFPCIPSVFLLYSSPFLGCSVLYLFEGFLLYGINKIQLIDFEKTWLIKRKNPRFWRGSFSVQEGYCLGVVKWGQTLPLFIHFPRMKVGIFHFEQGLPIHFYFRPYLNDLRPYLNDFRPDNGCELKINSQFIPSFNDFKARHFKGSLRLFPMQSGWMPT